MESFIKSFRTAFYMSNVLSLILAGGEGRRLWPLTEDIPKPLVPYMGTIPLINFPLSNLVNSHLRRIHVYTQYHSERLNEFVMKHWSRRIGDFDEFIDHRDGHFRATDQEYIGTAHAVFENLKEIKRLKPEYVVITSADHVYKLDFRQMLEYHREKNADATIAAKPVRADDAGRFGVLETKKGGRVTQFHEKVPEPPEIPDFPGYCLANMGIYIFNAQALYDSMAEEKLDFGHHVFPGIVRGMKIFAYNQADNKILAPYGDLEILNWMDLGTVRDLFAASMDQLHALPGTIDLYNQYWPIHNAMNGYAFPAKIHPAMRLQGGTDEHRLLVSPSCVVEACSLEEVILGPGVRIGKGADLTRVIAHTEAKIGENVNIKDAIVDAGAIVESGVEIGYDEDADRKRGFLPKDWKGEKYHTEGIRIIPRNRVATNNGLTPRSSEDLFTSSSLI